MRRVVCVAFFIFVGSLLGRIQGDREPVSFFLPLLRKFDLFFLPWENLTYFFCLSWENLTYFFCLSWENLTYFFCLSWGNLTYFSCLSWKNFAYCFVLRFFFFFCFLLFFLVEMKFFTYTPVGMSIEWLTGVSQVKGSRPDVFSCE